MPPATLIHSALMHLNSLVQTSQMHLTIQHSEHGEFISIHSEQHSMHRVSLNQSGRQSYVRSSLTPSTD